MPNLELLNLQKVTVTPHVDFDSPEGEPLSVLSD